MIKELLYEPFTVSVETLADFSRRPAPNSFFEMAYIISGKGQHRINHGAADYEPGDVFLLMPDDKDCFTVQERTTFFFLRFNDIYLKNSGILKDNVQKLESVLLNASQRAGCLVKNETDKPLVTALIEGLIREQINRDTCWEKMTLQLVNTLIAIIARNIEKYIPEEINEHKEDKTSDILQYIQTNIYNPQSIKAEHVSKTFGISSTYLGRYFKKHTGQTMQDYIAHYKLKLVENRLLHSTMRVSEIVHELGFSDESHLNKFFRKQTGVNPTEFRKAHLS